MRRLVSNFQHVAGRHCGSTALADWFRHFGHPIDEPMAFGLGAGLGCTYVEAPFLSPSRMLMTRAAQLEGNAFAHLGIPHALRMGADPWTVWETNRSQIDDDVPVIISCDLAFLPYWKTRTHFNGHRVLIAGYDAEARQAYIADTHFADLQAIGYDDLIRARTSQGPPLMSSDSLYHDPTPRTVLRPLAEAIPEALRRQARDLLESPLAEHGGVAGMRLMAERMARWREADDWKWCFRFSYQVIEKRGTGGAAFRRLYAEFLEQAEAILRSLAPLGLAARMRAIEADWARLGAEFHSLSEGESPPSTAVAENLTRRLADREEAWARDVLAADL